VADTLESCVPVLRYLNRPEKWAGGNILKFSKGKCKVLHLGMSNLIEQYRLGTAWKESSLAEKNLGSW